MLNPFRFRIRFDFGKFDPGKFGFGETHFGKVDFGKFNFGKFSFKTLISLMLKGLLNITKKSNLPNSNLLTRPVK